MKFALMNLYDSYKFKLDMVANVNHRSDIHSGEYLRVPVFMYTYSVAIAYQVSM